MSLTVPRAGVQAGRAPTIRVAQPETGATLAGFGDVMMQVGTALEAERLDRQRARDRLGLTQAMEDLRLEADQIGDPDQLETLWKQRTGEIRQRYLAGVDPKLQADAALEFDSLAQPHGAAIGRRQLDLMRDQRMATYTEQRAAVVRQAATLDPETGAELMRRHDAEIDGLVARGIIPADRAAAEKQGYRGDIAGARAIGLLDRDPAALVADIDGGRFADLTPEQAQSFRARATSAVAAEQARQATAAKVANNERIAEVKSRLKDRAGVLDKGRAIPDADEIAALLQDPEIAALPEAQAYVRSEFLFREMPSFAASSLAEKREVVAQLEASAIRTPDENRVLEAARQSLTAHEKAAREDIWTYAEGIGVAQARPLPAFGSVPEEDYAAALSARSKQAEALQASGMTEGAAPVLRPAEIADLAAKVEKTANPADRLAVARALSVLTPEQAQQAATQIKADGAFTILSGGYAAGVLDETLVRQTFEGQRILAAAEVDMPPKQELHAFLAQTYGGVFSSGAAPGQADQRAQAEAFREAVLARYAWHLAASGTRGNKTLDTELMQRAASEVIGGTSDGRGGIQPVRGRPTILPPGMTPDEIEGGLDMVADAIGSGSMIAADWQRLSPRGQVPDIGGAPPTETTMASVFLEARGDGYVLKYQVPGSDQPSLVRDAAGQPYVIDPARLEDLRKHRETRLQTWRDSQPPAVQAREKQEAEKVERQEGAQRSTETVTRRQQELAEQRERRAFEAAVRQIMREQPSLDRAGAERAVRIREIAAAQGVSLREAARMLSEQAAPPPETQQPTDSPR